ncbi:hypothetical protein [Actinoalloteichus spitiensis]|uniref:hypothetical protein n=1 Tax=Actinoalloteichus spitiensis TaxID=252394 RepID=UPI00035C2E77|nr:hypothetical protein [Actinoalloteichus spitiensis]
MSASEQWPVENEWATRELHWHAYVEDQSMASARSRRERLDGEPDQVLLTPKDVATWLDTQLKRATAPANKETGKRAKDDRDFGDSFRVHESLASRGESIYTGIRLDTTFAVEAVSPADCSLGDHTRPVTPLKTAKRRGSAGSGN